MAIDILTWVFAGGFAAVAIAFVYVIVAFIVPMRSTPAKHFVKAKREKRHVIILDAGKHFRFVVGDDKVGQEKNQVIRTGEDMIKVPNVGGLKYTEGNILMGIGEDFRNMITNTAIMDLMEALNRKGWDTEKVEALLTDLAANLKIDLGYVNGGEKIREQYEEDVAQINAQYDAAVERLQAGVNPQEDQLEAPRGDNPDEDALEEEVENGQAD